MDADNGNLAGAILSDHECGEPAAIRRPVNGVIEVDVLIAVNTARLRRRALCRTHHAKLVRVCRLHVSSPFVRDLLAVWREGRGVGIPRRPVFVAGDGSINTCVFIVHYQFAVLFSIGVTDKAAIRQHSAITPGYGLTRSDNAFATCSASGGCSVEERLCGRDRLRLIRVLAHQSLVHVSCLRIAKPAIRVGETQQRLSGDLPIGSMLRDDVLSLCDRAGTSSLTFSVSIAARSAFFARFCWPLTLTLPSATTTARVMLTTSRVIATSGRQCGITLSRPHWHCVKSLLTSALSFLSNAVITRDLRSRSDNSFRAHLLGIAF